MAGGCMSRTALYRHFDAAGALLYVGISLSTVQRLSQHKQRAGWYDQIASVTIEWHPTREAALTAEAIAIAKEGPLWNVVRPADGQVPRQSPFPSETNEVRCRGEALHQALWLGKQWAVTTYGIECRDGCYAIQSHRLLSKRIGTDKYDWPLHMDEKEWVDMADFCMAFLVACWIHHGVPIASHSKRAELQQ